jgi:hypothetical protein
MEVNANLANTEVRLLVVPEGEDPDDYEFEESENIPLQTPELTITPEPILIGEPFEIELGPVQDEEDNLVVGAPCFLTIETSKYDNDITVASQTDTQAVCEYNTGQDAVDQDFEFSQGNQEQMDGVNDGEGIGAIYGYIEYDGGTTPAPVNNYTVEQNIRGVSGFEANFGNFSEADNGQFSGAFFTTFNNGARVFIGSGIQTLLRTGGGNFILALMSIALGFIIFLYYRGGSEEEK